MCFLSFESVLIIHQKNVIYWKLLNISKVTLKNYSMFKQHQVTGRSFQCAMWYVMNTHIQLPIKTLKDKNHHWPQEVESYMVFGGTRNTILSRKVGWGVRVCWAFGWEKWHKGHIKEDDISDVMSKKKKKGQFPNCLSIHGNINWTQILNLFHVNKYRKRKAGCYLRGYYR